MNTGILVVGTCLGGLLIGTAAMAQEAGPTVAPSPANPSQLTTPAVYPPVGYGYPPVDETPPPPPMTSVAITISPLHLIIPVLEATAEFRLGQDIGVAVIGGFGSIKATNTSTRFSAYEAGCQFRYYLTGNFRGGLQIGAELLYVKVTGNVDNVTGVGQGLAVGPFVGWKYTSAAGFTFEAQGGVERVMIGASATDGQSTEKDSASTFIPLLNLNIGWSF